MDRRTNIQIYISMDKQTDKHGQNERQMNIRQSRQTDRQIDRQVDRMDDSWTADKAEWTTDRQTDKQADRMDGRQMEEQTLTSFSNALFITLFDRQTETDGQTYTLTYSWYNIQTDRWTDRQMSC